MNDAPLFVVAGALAGSDGRWLMQRRPLDKAHGGLWEFPGGKVEGTEIPTESLVRELQEELGIVVELADCTSAGFANESRKPDKRPIVILLYTISDWVGLPQALEGGEVGWFSPREVMKLEKPPLDQQLMAQLFEKRK
ncbi:MAG: (deoxy)nucleoside triphosphate pyrophosphohydrolase [Erythrobacter sp.]|uniref:(deoxy)nucleoside triphosphate pyrophosphohydrolase n=1 Tax=Erythrobacter sp. TaxID=1042 RepID=UPI00329813A8